MARAPAPDLMSAIFEGGDDKDPSKLRTGADGFREELLKQGNERASCTRPDRQRRAAATNEGNGGDNGSSEPLRRWKKSKNKSRSVRGWKAAKGR